MEITVIVSFGISTMDDLFGLLPALIALFHLNLARFTIIYTIIFEIWVSDFGVFWTNQSSANLNANKIKTVEQVISYL